MRALESSVPSAQLQITVLADREALHVRRRDHRWATDLVDPRFQLNDLFRAPLGKPPKPIIDGCRRLLRLCSHRLARFGVFGLLLFLLRRLRCRVQGSKIEADVMLLLTLRV